MSSINETFSFYEKKEKEIFLLIFRRKKRQKPIARDIFVFTNINNNIRLFFFIFMVSWLHDLFFYGLSTYRELSKMGKYFALELVVLQYPMFSSDYPSKHWPGSALPNFVSTKNKNKDWRTMSISWRSKTKLTGLLQEKKNNPKNKRKLRILFALPKNKNKVHELYFSSPRTKINFPRL